MRHDKYYSNQGNYTHRNNVSEEKSYSAEIAEVE